MAHGRVDAFRWSALLVALPTWLFMAVAPAAAQPAPSASSAPSAAAPTAPPAAEAPAEGPSAADKQLAKERFERGSRLFDDGAWGPALAEYLASLALFKTRVATGNAAVCLKKLGRYDEALDMYAALLKDFGDKLPPDAKQAALQEIEETRKLVATIEVEGSEVGAAIVIDGQERGSYPLLSPLRVAAGSHIVRVYKEGHEPFEKRLDTAGGTSARVVARLPRLKETGTLQVSESLGRALSVVVDGIAVGTTGASPLLVPLAPGKHVVLLRGEGTLGTAPASLTIQANEVAPLRIEAEALDATLRIEPTPFDALVSIDSVLVGRGLWDGRVRPGGHTIEIAAEGFLPETRKVLIGRDQRESVAVLLARDPRSPFWREPPPPPHFLGELSTGFPLFSSLGGDALSGCASGCASPPGFGASLVARGGYELGSGLSFGAAVGYLSTLQVVRRRSISVTPVGQTAADAGVVDDSVRLRGTLLGAWAGYWLGDTFRLHLQLGAGGLLGAVSDVRTGTLKTDVNRTIKLGPFEQQHDAPFFYVAPSVRAGVRVGQRLQLTAGVELMVLIAAQQPAWTEQPFTAGKDGYATFPRATLTSSVLPVFVPTVGARYDFL